MYRAYFVLFCSLLTLSACQGSVDGSAQEMAPADSKMQGGNDGEISSDGGQGAPRSAGGGGSNTAGGGGRADGGNEGGGGIGGAMAGTGGMAGAAPVGGAMGMGSVSGAAGAAGSSPAGDGPPPGWVPAAIAVGYAGNRALTRDYGQTWTNKTQLAAGGGDDENLLRGVAFGRGKWVAVGWKHLMSEDGANWTVVKRQNGCGLMEDIAYGNGVFLGMCGDNAHTSTDGITFSQGSRIGGTGGHTYVWFGNGLFVASGNSGASFSSPDGKKWTAMPQRRVWFCNNEFRTETDCGSAAWADGYFVREKYPLGFQRSMDGKTWQASGAGRGTYRIRFGYAPPVPVP